MSLSRIASTLFPCVPPNGNGTVEPCNKISIGGRVLDIAEVQRLIPELEGTIGRKNVQLNDQQKQIEAHLKRIAELESDVVALQSECDMLRSVLDQKAQSAAAAKPVTNKNSDEIRGELQMDTGSSGPTTAAGTPAPGDDDNGGKNRSKKIAVSAEPTAKTHGSAKLVHYEKSAGSKQLIREAVAGNEFLRQLAKDQVHELIDCMYEHTVRQGETLIREGEQGDKLYVAEDGEFEVSRAGVSLGTMRAGRVFGELAILYNCTRTASVQAVCAARVWVLDRSAFQMITQRLGRERIEMRLDFLKNVPLFQGLGDDRLSKIVDCLDQEYYADGHYIIREGEQGDTFFIIQSGRVKVTQLVEGSTDPQEVRTLGKGDFFGEKALLCEELRTASVVALAPGVEVLTLDREHFVKLIGDLDALRKDYGDEQRRAQRLRRRSDKENDHYITPATSTASESASIIRELRTSSPTRPAQRCKEFEHLSFAQLRTIATLGVGGFGRVELVYIPPDKARSYALKALKKKHIVDTRQQEHLFSERNLMLEMDSEWIVKLFCTFRDSKYVYMLMEVCLGGELWSTLRDRGHFDDYTARFYVACSLEGLEYLHRRRIVYRDLKPENCLLTETGFMKLVDFGFAKKLAVGRKTWTFCGTPEYVSPEIILNKGHDHAADYWALGIYICELMLGRPPFQANDPMKTYTLILKGVDALDIPNRRIGKTATALVKKLCRENPGERLGCGAGGIQDIRRHRWFMGFDWEGLRARTVRPPIQPRVSGPMDASNFDQYPPDADVPPDEFSGWDEGF